MNMRTYVGTMIGTHQFVPLNLQTPEHLSELHSSDAVSSINRTAFAIVPSFVVFVRSLVRACLQMLLSAFITHADADTPHWGAHILLFMNLSQLYRK